MVERQQEASGSPEVTLAVTCRAAAAARGLSPLVTKRTLRELQELNLSTAADLSDMVHQQELLTFAECAYATTKRQLLTRPEWEKKPKIVPNTFPRGEETVL